VTLDSKDIQTNRHFCDLCKQQADPIRECRLPYGKEKAGKEGRINTGRSRWYDLCERCILAVRALPQEFVDQDTDLRWMAREPVLVLQAPLRQAERGGRRGKGKVR
jgi:hypothetical protein